MAKIGTLSHVKGFILNKLFEKHCFTGSGRTHGKHMTAKNLPAGYLPQYHRLFGDAIRELRTEGLIHVFPARTGRDSEDHVTIVRDNLANSRSLINAYRKSVGLLRLRRDLTEFPMKEPK
jgi:hypothetical protein